MTEQEWFAVPPRPHQMLRHVFGFSGERKLLLYTAACCSQRAHFVRDERVLAALRFVEGAADAPADEDAHMDALEASLAANEDAYQVWIRLSSGTPEASAARWQYDIAYVLWSAIANPRAGPNEALTSMGWSSQTGADPLHLALLHDVFGNPFRPAAVDPAWLTTPVVQLARGIYDEKAFDRLPILADALMDAGCGDEQILTHLRGDGPHARGCWVVDLLLGKG